MIVNKPISGKSASQSNSQDKKKQKEHDIDISSIDRLKKGSAVSIDPNSDAWERVAPPLAGYYAFSPSITKDGIKGIERTEGNPESMFFKVNLELKFHSADPDIAGAVMFANVSTYIGRGKQLSTVLGLMLKSNKKPKTIPSPITDVDQLLYLKKWLGAQPLVYGFADWQSWSKNQQKVVCKGMENYPQDDDGNYIGSVEVDGEECNANMKLIKFITPEEFKQIQAEKETSGNGAGTVDIPEEKEESKPVAKVQAKAATPTTTKATASIAQPTQPTQIKNKDKKAAPIPPPSLEMDEEEESTVSGEDDTEIDIEDFIASDED